MNTYTLQDAKNIAYSIIKSDEGATAYPPELLTTFINKYQLGVCAGNIKNLITLERTTKISLPFLNKSQFYTSVIRSSVSSCTAGSTTLDAVTSGFATSGYLYIKGNIVTYTGITGSQFTGIPATGDGSIVYSFEGGTPILQLFQLPSDFMQATTVIYNRNQRLTNIDQRDIINETTTSNFLSRFFRDDFSTDYSNMEYYYAIIDNLYILPIIPSIPGRMIRLDYQKIPTKLVYDTDIFTIPDEYSMNTVPYLAIAEMMYNRGEADEGARLNAFGYDAVIDMYKFYQTQKNELRYNQRVRTQKDLLYPNI